MPKPYLPTLLLSAAVFAALLTSGCVSTANDNPASTTTADTSQRASTIFSSRLQAADGVQTTLIAENSVKVAFSGNNMFSHDGTGISAQAQQQLAQVAAALNNIPYTNALVLGHTDSSGQLAYNNKLSQQRAEQVRAVLIQQGVAVQQVAAEGRGPAEPIADNKTAQGRAANRRVELIITFE